MCVVLITVPFITYYRLILFESFCICHINPLPNAKIFYQSKLKAFADEKINVTEEWKFVLERVENIVGNGEKCWLPAFSPFFHIIFKRPLIQGHLSRDCEVKS